MWTRPWLLTAHLVLLALPRPAHAADRVQECIGEHVEAQLLRKQGRLVAARDRLLECATSTCPALVRDECAALMREVEAAVPTVILSAADANGDPMVDPLVSVDGSRDLIPLDGQPIALDPGQHQLRFEHPDGRIREVSLVLAEAERDRLVVADFRPRADRDSGPHTARGWQSSVLLVSAGVAVAALGTFTYFALAGRSVENELDRCKPNCESSADVDRMRSRYLIADVSLGVTLVSLGVGAYAWTQRPSAPPAAGSRGSTQIGVSVQPSAAHPRLGLWATGEF